MHFYSVYLRYATYWQNNYCCMFIINTAKTEYLVSTKFFLEFRLQLDSDQGHILIYFLINLSTNRSIGL